ncbi:hypothetical protein DU508_02910 [Pedobacter chinensis]|uniref:Galactose oxidase n=1 Tax=Pedobacter chinensis TaxID=2282421 RepID=A0A369Q0A1_9SPHI|nr:kelch repeat-containing protein [Pedobacter chinensis]RDC57920.1 hypothetical protein DU508_02910 [Pedobacter chinensis]
MKIIYLTFLLTLTITPALMGQEKSISQIEWGIPAQIPPSVKQIKPIGLAGAISGMHNGVLIVAGGTNFPEEMPWLGGTKKYYDDIFVYQDINSNTSFQVSRIRYKLPFNLAYAAVCSTPQGIVIAGGDNENGLSKKVLLLKWSKADEILGIDFLPDLPFAVTNAAITIVDQTLYLGGGETDSGVSEQFLSLDLKRLYMGWKKLPNLIHPCSHAVILGAAQVDQIFLIGGRSKIPGQISTLFSGVYAYDIKKNTWDEKKSLSYPLSAASGVVKGHDILIFSGDKGETFHKTEELIININKEKDPAKKEILNQRKIEIQSNHPGFNQKVLKYNLLTDQWSTLKDKMPYGTVTVNAVISNDLVFIPGGEIKAGVRTPSILRGKLKFNQ